MRPLLRAAGPLSLLAATLLAVVGAFAITSARHGLLMVAALLLVLLACVDGWRATAARAAIGVFAALSLATTTWLYAGHSIDSSLGAASRVLYLVLPGMVLAAYLDPVRLGDHLAQRLRLPHRPVVASCVALQRIDAIGDDFDQIRRARRSRGMAADHGLVRRVRAMAGMTFSLLVSTLRSAGPTSLAMDARGFATATRRTWAEPAPWVAADWAVLALGAAFAAFPWLTR
jgi:energy-coupling factor transporter transmembrane protein EcfT